MVYFNLYLILLIEYLVSIKCHDDFEYYKLTKGTSFIYYKKKADKDNTITGTGNRLKDVMYRSKCSVINCTTCCEGSLNNLTCLNFQQCYDIQKNKIPFNIYYYMICFIFVYITLPIGWILTKILELKRVIGYNKIKTIFVIYSSILLPPYGIVILVEYLFVKKKGANIQSSLGENNDFVKLFYKKKFQVTEFRNGVAKSIELNEKKNEYDHQPIEEDNIVLESI
jgi:hypothetical protein